MKIFPGLKTETQTLSKTLVEHQRGIAEARLRVMGAWHVCRLQGATWQTSCAGGARCSVGGAGDRWVIETVGVEEPACQIWRAQTIRPKEWEGEQLWWIRRKTGPASLVQAVACTGPLGPAPSAESQG